MPQHKSAAKRARQNEKRRNSNRLHKSRLRTRIKTLQGMESADEARPLLNDVKGDLDRLATRRIISPNFAARMKARLEQRVNSL